MADRSMTYTLEVHNEGPDGYWTEVKELPGCFASGFSLEELYEAVEEAIGLYLSNDGHEVTVRIESGVTEERRTFELCDV